MRKTKFSKPVIFIFLSIFMTTTSMAAPVPMEDLVAVNGTHTAVLFTRVLANPLGLCINAALSFLFASLGAGAMKLLTMNFNKNRGESPASDHAAQNPMHVLGLAIGTGVTVALSIQGFQNFISAVQNWYTTPPNSKPVEN